MPKKEFLTVARQVGLPAKVVEYCLEVGLVQPGLSQHDLAELRRIRRLQHQLEVNLAGAEIILRMRRRMQAMQAEMQVMQAELAEQQARFEQEFQRLQRRLAQDI
jgi:DNA-binding transcriptional MerR regulator